jgi:L-2,4-diaminobutyric acid acetyltransferase
MPTSNRKADPTARPAGDALRLRMPVPRDGARVWQLIRECPPLDRNSMYCNVLQCTDFADTCVIAELHDRVVGWISAYRPPDDDGTLFIWQVAVHEKARGMGLAKKMLNRLLRRSDRENVEYLKTTITEDNEPSRALFRSFAEHWDAPLEETAGFDEELHFRGQHDSERLITIGPFPGKGAGANQSAEERSAA